MIGHDAIGANIKSFLLSYFKPIVDLAIGVRDFKQVKPVAAGKGAEVKFVWKIVKRFN